MKPLHTLYLCYFGLREPLVQTQVLPYLRELAAGGVKVSLLTFEPDFKKRWNAEQINVARATFSGQGISWHCLPYHKSPSVPATFYDVLNGARFALSLARREKIDVIHARAHIALMMALLAKPVLRCRVIFDVRGLIADEYADAGVWHENSMPFRLVKKVERLGFKRAEQIVVLTDTMKKYLLDNKLKAAQEIEVVPCCVDFSRIQLSENENVKKSARFELIYAGSVVGLYMLEEMGRFFLELKKRVPDAFFRVLTISPPEKVKEVFARLEIKDEDFVVQSAAPEDVPALVKQARLAISFRKPTFSQIAASPTKIPEYLASGVPVVVNAGIGDTDNLIKSANVGVIVQDFNENLMVKAVDSALKLLEDETLAARCVETAMANFDLVKIGGANYLNVYKRIAFDLEKA